MKDTKFNLGSVYMTSNAMNFLTPSDVFTALLRHSFGDWGMVGEEDWKANDDAVAFGLRILSVYRSFQGDPFWIITEADRSSTTVLMPEDY